MRCDRCGKFRKRTSVMGTGNEYEEWTVCTECMSPQELSEFAHMCRNIGEEQK